MTFEEWFRDIEIPDLVITDDIKDAMSFAWEWGYVAGYKEEYEMHTEELKKEIDDAYDLGYRDGKRER